jgi:CBS domain-containing protein
MPTRHVPFGAAGERVQDVMLRESRTLPPDAPADEARALFQNPKVRLLLVCDRDGRFVGVLTPEALSAAPAAVQVADVVDPDAARVAPTDGIARALAELDRSGADRLPVVDEAGALRGLVCINRKGGFFCVDAGDAARPGPGRS